MANTDPDAAIIQRIRTGETELYDALFRRYAAWLSRRAFYQVHDRDVAEDMVQEALLHSFRHLDQLRDPARYRQWLSRILDNVCRAWRRQTACRVVTTPLPVASLSTSGAISDSPEARYARGQLRQTVSEICAGLPEALRTAALLYYVGGLSCREVATALGAPLPTVESRLHKARSAIRRMVAGRVRTSAQSRLADRLRSLAQEVFVMDAIRIEISAELIPLVQSKDPDTNMLSLIGQLRRELEAEHAVLVPKMHVIDNLKLAARSFAVFVQEQSVATGFIEDSGDLAGFRESLKRAIMDHRKGLSTPA